MMLKILTVLKMLMMLTMLMMLKMQFLCFTKQKTSKYIISRINLRH